jgi:hypothetical protein
VGEEGVDMAERSRGWAVVAGFAAACTITVDVVEPGQSPVGVVLRPAPDEGMAPGRYELLGSVSDPQDPPETLFATWSVGSDADGWSTLCDGFAEPDGTTRCVADLPAGATAVRLRVVDLAGFEDEEIVAVRVRDVAAPTVSWGSPLAPGPFFENVTVPFRLTVADADTPLDALVVTVSSPTTGVLALPASPDAAGQIAGDVTLPRGVHTLEATVVDPDGARATVTSRIAVAPPNLPPTCAFDLPADGFATLPDAPFDVRASALDDVARPEDLVWRLSSDLDGALATGSPGLDGWVDATAALEPGLHALTLTVTDPFGGEGSCAVTVVSDTPPLLIVATPVPDQRVPRGQPLTIALRVEDAVTPATDLVVRAVSDRDGPRWTQSPRADGTLTVQTALSPGVHQVTVSVMDAYGLGSQDVISVIME